MKDKPARPSAYTIESVIALVIASRPQLAAEVGLEELEEGGSRRRVCPYLD